MLESIWFSNPQSKNIQLTNEILNHEQKIKLLFSRTFYPIDL